MSLIAAAKSLTLQLITFWFFGNNSSTAIDSSLLVFWEKFVFVLMKRMAEHVNTVAPHYLPFESSSSIVVLESVDSFTWDPSLFFDIMFLLEKFRVANIVVRIAPCAMKLIVWESAD